MRADLQPLPDLCPAVAGQTGLPVAAVRAVLGLFAEGSTLPFIARYRKEATGGLDEVQIGAELPGIVTNVTAFGAFVDIGVHQDGLLHISELQSKAPGGRVERDPQRLVTVGQRLTVSVLSVDLPRRRIALSRVAEGG